VDEMASVREVEILSVVSWASGREISFRGKHRTEVTEATEGDLGWVAKILSVTAWTFVREIGATEKHRTEVTEATEGIGVGGQNSIGGSVGVCTRNQVQQKASHRGHRGHGGGLGVGGQNSIGGRVGVWARNRCNRKASHRGHRGRIEVGSQKFYWRQRGRPGEKSNPRGKHRTEVAEGDWVRWSKILSATEWACGRN
jgi:hypothetical protein